MTVDSAKKFIEDILFNMFPALCPLCRKKVLASDEYFCPTCFDDFQMIEPPFCHHCGVPLSGRREHTALLCLKCLTQTQKARSIQKQLIGSACRIRSVAVYRGKLRQAILMLKYYDHLYLAASLGEFLKEHYSFYFPERSFDCILPVPLHPQRLRQREFNQCVLMARPLSKHLKIPLDLDSVARTRHTFSQSVSKSAERKRNLKGAFQVIRPSSIEEKQILLVDDVVTTGATLEALTTSLVAAGAKNVSAFTLARSPITNP